MVDFTPFTGLAATDNNTQYQANSVVTTANAGTVIAATSMVIVPATGYVGIGTTNPLNNLDIRGNASATGSLNVGGAATVNSLVVNAGVTFGSFNIIGALQAGTINSNNTIQSAGTTTANALISNVYGLFGQNVTVNSTNASTTTTNGALVVAGGIGVGGNINTGGSVNLFTGQIGVGTTTSAGLGSATNSSNVYVWGNVIISNTASTSSGVIFPDGTIQTSAASPSLATLSYGLNGTVQFANTSNTFLGDSTNFFWDNSNKRLGIGTSTPSTVLSVYGDTPALFNTRTGGGTRQEIFVSHSTSTSNGTVLGNDGSVGSFGGYGYLRRGESTVGSPAISFTYVSANHRVGINGVTQPQNALDVSGAVAIGNSYAGLAALTNTNGMSVQGRVGIGTIAPNTANNNILTLFSATGAGIELVSGGASAGGGNIQGSSGGGLVFSTFTGGVAAESYTERMRIDSNGDIGLGVVDPLSTLDVGGIASFRSAVSFAGAVVVASLNSNTNVVGVNLQSTGLASVSSLIGNNNVFGATLQSSGTSQVNALISNASIQSIGTITTAALNSNGAIVGSSLTSNGTVVGATTATFNAIYSNTFIQGGAFTAASLNSNGAIVGSSINSNGAIQANGAVTVNSLNSNTNVVGVTLQSTGQTTVASLVANTNIFSATMNTSGLALHQSLQSNTTIVAGTGLTVTTGGATITGPSSVTGNLTITGNLIVFGNVVANNSNVLVVNDPLIYLASQNPSNLYDIGIVGNYVTSASFQTGLVRDNTDSSWNLFDTYTTNVGVGTNNINWNDATLTYAKFKAGNVTIAGNAQSTSSSTGSLILSGVAGAGIGGNINVDGQRSVFTGNMTINGTNVSTSSTTGAVIINTGGMGIGGNINVGGQQNVISGNILLSGTNVSTSSTTGALVVTNGVGIGGNLNINGGYANLTLASSRIVADFTNATIASRAMFQTSTVNSPTLVGAIPSGTGTSSGFNAYNTADPTNSVFMSINIPTGATATRLESGVTGSGTFLPIAVLTSGTERMRVDVTGNVGIGSAMSVAGSFYARDITSNGSITMTSLTVGGTATVNALVSNVYGLFGQNVTVNSANVSTSTSTGALIITTGGLGVGGNVNAGGQRSVFTGNMTINGTNVSTSSTTGALIVLNGVGAGGNLNIGGQQNTYTGNMLVSGSNVATNSTTGALIVAQGVGVGGNVYVGNRVGFASGGSSVVYQAYNPATSSLDVVFG